MSEETKTKPSIKNKKQRTLSNAQRRDAKFLKGLKPVGPMQIPGRPKPMGAGIFCVPAAEPGKKFIAIQISEQEIIALTHCIGAAKGKHYVRQGVLMKLTPVFQTICREWLGQ